MKTVIFSQHALDQLKDRGTSEEEIKKAIQELEALRMKIKSLVQ